MNDDDTPPLDDGRRGSLLARHWRGQLPPGRSFWLHFVLPVTLLTLAIGGIGTALPFAGGPLLRAGAAAVLLGWPLLAALTVWGAVGAWRAMAACESAFGAHAGRGALLLMVLAVLALAVQSLGAHGAGQLSLVQGADPIGRASATVTADGRRLRLHGPLGMGDALRVAAVLDAAAQVHMLELDSAGGRFEEAQRLALSVRARGLQTRVVGACDNACTLVFLAGRGRQVMPDARLGLHRIAPAGPDLLFRPLADRLLAATYRRAGLPEIFIVKASSMPPPRLWHPETDELVNAALVGNPDRPLDIDLPAPGAAPLDDFADALRSHWIWQAIDRRHPGSVAAAAQRMFLAREGGATDEAVQVAGQRIVEGLLPALRVGAGPALHELYFGLLADQLQAAATAGPAACRALLAGDAEVRHGLPAALLRREADWLTATLAEPPAAPPRRLSAIELEVMHRTLSRDAPARLRGLLGPARGRATDCTTASALVASVLGLPPAERRLALRLVFGRD